MTRQTVIVTTPDDSTERRFHLSPERARAFAAKITRQGGTARVVPFQMSAEQTALLAKVGIKCAS